MPPADRPVLPAPPADRLPAGFAVELDPRTRRLGPALLLGGGPARLLRLSDRAAALLLGAQRVTVRDTTTASLARRLLDADLAHPRPTARHTADDVTVVIPVRDRADGLARLLTALGPARVIVVDDGSADPAAVRAVCAGAQVIRYASSRGPAAARNAGLAAARTDLVAFIDSDCVPREGWLDLLLAHLSDPLVAAAAPRIVSLVESGGGALGAYERARSSLDLGPREAPVVARGRVAYVPSAALLVRRAALGPGFDEDLHVAEDVDLVWRLGEQGWRVRYEPRSIVAHEHRVRPREWAVRKAFYGSGADLLASRHPGKVPPLAMSPWTLAAWALLLAPPSRWRAAGATAALTVTAVAGARLTGRLDGADRPGLAAGRLVAEGLVGAGRQLADATGRHGWPLAAVAALASPRARHLALGGIVVGGLADWVQRRPDLDPVRYVALHAVDDAAYGLGLWAGALRGRSLAALRPDLSGPGQG